jgi:type VI secretion system protein ImpL
MVLLVSAQVLVDGSEEAVESYAKEQRRQLIEVSQAFGADIPVYVVVTAYDTLWGFGDVFRWTAQRRDEEPWGFSLLPGLPPSETPGAVAAALEGLSARIESMCFAKLSTEDPSDERMRAFQHLTDARELCGRLRTFLHVVTMANAFERAPWMRALAIGSGIPGTGNRLRHNIAQLMSVGLHPPAQSGTLTPGGMPLHALLTHVLLPEKDLVPTRVRWRDDKLSVLTAMLGIVLWLGLVIVLVAQAAR